MSREIDEALKSYRIARRDYKEFKTAKRRIKLHRAAKYLEDLKILREIDTTNKREE